MTNQKVSIHRVQVNLPPHLYTLVRKWAYEENISISAVLRNTIETYKKKTPIKTVEDALWKKFTQDHVGSITGKYNDATSHDTWAHKTALFSSPRKK